MSIKRVPLRQCTGYGEMRTKKEVVRVLETPEGKITLDVTGRRSSRGTYVRLTMEYLKEAVKSKGLERSFKMAIPGGVCEALEKEMEWLEGQRKGV